MRRLKTLNPNLPKKTRNCTDDFRMLAVWGEKFWGTFWEITVLFVRVSPFGPFRSACAAGGPWTSSIFFAVTPFPFPGICPALFRARGTFPE